jgi:osmoprotectant transport system permease protein
MKWSWDRFLVAVMERAPQALFVHTRMVLVALIAAIVISVPIGILLTRPRLKWLGGIILNILNLLQTFPGLAIVALAMPILGMGFKPAVFALIIQGLLPIARNTIAGLYGVDPDIMEAARGMGMAERKILYEVEIPLAMPVILAGIRTSAVYVVSVATLAAYIGGGGLGDLIVSGLNMFWPDFIVVGAGLGALLAIFFDRILGVVEKKFTPLGYSTE